MSQADADLVRQWWADAGSLNAAAQLAHWAEHAWADNIEWRAIEGAPDDHGPMYGRERLMGYYGDWAETFEDMRISPLEIIDAGDGQVVVVQRASGRAKASGVPVDLTYAVLYALRDGRVASGREFLTREEALHAARESGPETAAQRRDESRPPS
jgi:ketosteroid isomerase-like protein